MPSVCKSVGNVDRAYRLFLEIKAMPGAKLDAFVYGILIATCAEAMKRDLAVAHERKEQYVLLEKAFQYVAEAEQAGIALASPVYNALLVCAGRCGELNRAFQVMEMMQQRGVPPTVITYGSLIEACVEAKQPDKARRVFEIALSKVRDGITHTRGRGRHGVQWCVRRRRCNSRAGCARRVACLWVAAPKPRLWSWRAPRQSLF